MRSQKESMMGEGRTVLLLIVGIILGKVLMEMGVFL